MRSRIDALCPAATVSDPPGAASRGLRRRWLHFITIQKMPFETFTRQRRVGRQPYVTIQKKGVISLNRAAFEALESPDSVELLYDPDARQVALRKVDSSVEHAYQVRAPVPNHATWLVSGSAFTAYYEIDTSSSVRRAARTDGDLLIVDLNDPGVDPRGEATDTAEMDAPEEDTPETEAPEEDTPEMNPQEDIPEMDTQIIDRRGEGDGPQF
jgi:hypothetical protein